MRADRRTLADIFEDLNSSRPTSGSAVDIFILAVYRRIFEIGLNFLNKLENSRKNQYSAGGWPLGAGKPGVDRGRFPNSSPVILAW